MLEKESSNSRDNNQGEERERDLAERGTRGEAQTGL